MLFLFYKLSRQAPHRTTQAAAYWIFIVGFHSTLGHLKYSALDYSWSDRETEAFPALAKNRFNLQGWACREGGRPGVQILPREQRDFTQRATDWRIKWSLAKFTYDFMIFQSPIKDQINKTLWNWLIDQCILDKRMLLLNCEKIFNSKVLHSAYCLINKYVKVVMLPVDSNKTILNISRSWHFSASSAAPRPTLTVSTGSWPWWWSACWAPSSSPSTTSV